MTLGFDLLHSFILIKMNCPLLLLYKKIFIDHASIKTDGVLIKNSKSFEISIVTENKVLSYNRHFSDIIEVDATLFLNRENVAAYENHSPALKT